MSVEDLTDDGLVTTHETLSVLKEMHEEAGSEPVTQESEIINSAMFYVEEQMNKNNSECPQCGEEWSWATANSSRTGVLCSQAESFCITEDEIYLHGGGGVDLNTEQSEDEQ